MTWFPGRAIDRRHGKAEARLETSKNPYSLCRFQGSAISGGPPLGAPRTRSGDNPVGRDAETTRRSSG